MSMTTIPISSASPPKLPHILPLSSVRSFAFSSRFTYSTWVRSSSCLFASRTPMTMKQQTTGRIRCGAVQEIDEARFSDVVLKSDRPVLVEFVATWCGPCRLIAPAVASLAQEYEERLTIVKIDHDSNPGLIEGYKVYGLPTLILFKDGKEVPDSRREGAITKVKLKEYVDALLQSASVA